MVAFPRSYVNEPENDTIFSYKFFFCFGNTFSYFVNVGYSMKCKRQILRQLVPFQKGKSQIISVFITDI